VGGRVVARRGMAGGMNREKRRAGRAIRKQRREMRRALEAYESIDWMSVVRGMGQAFAQIAEAVERTMSVFADAAVRAAQQVGEQEWRERTVQRSLAENEGEKG
jgi:hypothetical protein